MNSQIKYHIVRVDKNLCVHAYTLCASVHTHVIAGIHKGQKKALAPWSWSFRWQ